jgi:hypothetical protein
MSRLKQAYLVGLLGYIAGVGSLMFLPTYIALGVPAIGVAGAVYMLGRISKARSASKAQSLTPPVAETVTIPTATGPASGQATGPASQSLTSTNTSSAGVDPSAKRTPLPLSPLDEEWQQVNEYIETIEDMVILEGKQHNLDNEIVEKTLTLLSRLNRVIPQLRVLNDSGINHNIKRLVLKDLNGVITPFLSLSGEAKQKNRRLLLNGLKDIDSKMTFYTETIEQKDLLELKTKAELIRQRYNTEN